MLKNLVKQGFNSQNYSWHENSRIAGLQISIFIFNSRVVELEKTARGYSAGVGQYLDFPGNSIVNIRHTTWIFYNTLVATKILHSRNHLL